MKETKDGFQLSTGREFYAHAHYLCPDDDGAMAYGYDGYVYEHDNLDALTPSERREIADYFIEKWKSWAARESEGA